jgi:hypothetical protein
MGLKWKGKYCGTEVGREALWDSVKLKEKCCGVEVGKEMLRD